MEKLLFKLKGMWEENTKYLILLSVFNFTGYGVLRYFLGKYIEYPIYIKVLKFSLTFLNFFMFISLIYFILYLINKSVAKIILKIYMAISFVLFLIDCILLYKFGLNIGNTTVQLLAETNKNEINEFLRTYLNYQILFIVVGIGIMIYLFSKIKVRIKSKVTVYLLSVLMFAQIFAIKKDIVLLKSVPAVKLYKGIENTKRNLKFCAELNDKLSSNIKIIKNESNIKNIIFIIGESTTRNHMSLYGYKLQTNPELEKLKNEGNLFVFNDVISPHGNTLSSLKKVLTFYNTDSNKDWSSYNNLMDIMKKSDYKTYWFSNQESLGFFANTIATLAKRSENVLFNVNADYGDINNMVGRNYDEQIVEKSKDKTSDKDKNFIIYHLMGCHRIYNQRYPEKFEKFSSEDYKNKDLKNKQKRRLATYDNAILYNDYVVNEIVNLYKNEESIVIYISDHAEEVYDFRDFSDHTEGPNLSHYMLEIPCVIYVSDKLKEKNPQLVKRIEESENNPYMTDDLIHTILDISNIETEEFDETRSVINKNFNSNRERKIHGKSYEGYWKNKN